MALNTMMQYKFGIIHTPGAFGNFLGYVFDCYQQQKLLPEPFVAGGASHDNSHRSIPCLDLVVPECRKKFETDQFDNLIGCVWGEDQFAYILHAIFGRTNMGQYKGCGVEFLEENFYDFVKLHDASSAFTDIELIQDFFNYEVSETNKRVPRHILRQYFWLQLFYYSKHVVCAVNREIKNMEKVDHIDIIDILDYTNLQKFMTKYFQYTMDFESVHKKFVQKNSSLTNIRNAQNVVNSVLENKVINIDKMTVIAEAYVLYHLEKHYFDIPFFNMKQFPTSTSEFLEHIKYYPDVMKQPNKLYAEFYRRFPPNA